MSGEKNTPSNVTRLARSLEHVALDDKDKVWQQIVWYDSGVGTSFSGVENFAGNWMGAGLEGNIIEAYNFVVLNYTEGDQIMCFGFSRGAYTARSIAGLISDIGICEPRNMHLFPEIWELYKKGKAGEKFYGSDAYFEWVDGKGMEKQPEDLGYKNCNYKWEKPPHGDWNAVSREIEVVGVFDTVGALGLPSIRGWDPLFWQEKPNYFNVKLNRNIKHAFHALALDEHRESYTPTLWYIPEVDKPETGDIENQIRLKDEAEAKWYSAQLDRTVSQQTKQELKLAYNKARRGLIIMEENLKDEPELLQVWFPGVHINVGGGSTNTLKNKGDLEEISNITFAWLLDQIRPYLGVNQTTVNQEARARQNYIDEINARVDEYETMLAAKKEATAQESWAQWVTRSVGSAASSIMQPLTGTGKPPIRRDRGWGTGAWVESYTSIYKANGSKPRTPGNYAKDTKQTTLGRTFESVHPTVGYRMHVTRDLEDEKLRYKPLGENKVVRQKKPGGGWEYLIDGVTLSEYKMKSFDSFGGEPSFERLAIEGEPAWEYVKKLDEENEVRPGQSINE